LVGGATATTGLIAGGATIGAAGGAAAGAYVYYF